MHLFVKFFFTICRILFLFFFLFFFVFIFFYLNENSLSVIIHVRRKRFKDFGMDIHFIRVLFLTICLILWCNLSSLHVPIARLFLLAVMPPPPPLCSQNQMHLAEVLQVCVCIGGVGIGGGGREGCWYPKPISADLIFMDKDI